MQQKNAPKKMQEVRRLYLLEQQHRRDEARIRELEDALEQVVRNWEYQKKTGAEFFTSRPTEIMWKKESKEKTRAMVEKALSDKEDGDE